MKNMNQSNKSTLFLQAIDDIWNTPVPPEVMARARRSLLDYLAVTCAGAAFQKEKIDRYLDFAMSEAGDYKAVGTGRSLAFAEAVFLNGLNGHALDYDDGTNSGIIHLGSPIFSLLLPLAQRYGKTVDEVLTAAVTGYEASYTMAISIQPGHKAFGYHATGTCGTLGATLAASYLLGFSDEERLNAFSAACVAAGGMLKSLDNGSELKPYNVAKTAMLAMTALRMGKAGFHGDGDPLGGRGFLHMMTGRDDVENIELKPTLAGGTYAIMKSYTKPYASCRYTHPPVEAAIRLREEMIAEDHGQSGEMCETVKAKDETAGDKGDVIGRGMPEEVIPAWIEDITDINVRTYDLAVGGHDHTEIPGSYSAKMSTPYSVAAALVHGKAGLQEFTEEAVRDEATLALASKVHVEADDSFSAAFPGEQTAVLTIHLGKDAERKNSDSGEAGEAAGRTLTARVDFPKGEPENPMSEEEFRSRYMELMAYGQIDTAAAEDIYRKVYTEGTMAAELVEKL